MHLVPHHRRQQRLKPGRAKADAKTAHQHPADRIGMETERKTRADRWQDRAADRWRHFRAPAHQHPDQRDVTDGVDRERGRHARQRDQDAAQRRADAAGKVKRNGIQRDRLRQIARADLRAHRGLPRRAVERSARPHRQGEKDQAPRADHPFECQHCQRRRDDQHRPLGRQHHPAAVEIIGDRACQHAE